METICSTSPKLSRMLANILSIVVIFAMAFPATSIASAAAGSPFVGHWEAIDVDGSDIRLSISGPPNGPFQITWTESYISFCDGGPGIVRGMGWQNDEDANLLEADLRVECFTTGASLDFHLVWRYHAVSNMLSSRDGNGVVTIWHRPGGGRVQEPPALGLRVIYGYDWVHSFYEGGHMVWLTVTESDGVTVKATAELVTEPLDSLGGETGFDIRLEDWVPAPPDIQPYDWVYGWVDNGASAHVQIGDISGMIDLENDSIEGMISAPWFSSELDVDCHPWGAPLPEEILKYDSVLPDGEDTYSCSWAGEWDIQPGQDVGVGYSGPDGHWVANVFSVPLPSFAAYMPSAIEGYDWPIGNTITLNINDGEYTAQAISEQRPDFPEGETRVLFELWWDEFSMETGDHILMTDEALGFSKELYVADLQVLAIDLSTQMVSGIYEPAYPEFWIWLDGQEPLDVQFDENIWVATFAEMVPGTWGTVAQDDWDHDGTVWDFNVPNTRFTVWPEQSYLEGYEWPDGAVVSISVDGKEVCSTEAVSGFPEWDPSNTFFSLNFPEDCDIGAGDSITLSAESLSFTHQVQELAITDVNLDLDTVAGTADFDPEQYLLHTWIHGVDGSYIQLSAEGGAWLADFSFLEGGLQPGMGGRVELVDQASNATAVEWNTPPAMSLRVNYGHDWVESFYEAGHAVSIQVTDSEGNVKATSELMTEPKEYWGGETGFQSFDSVWFDGDGNQMENAPDLQSYDWVYAQVDNGVTAQVQLGDIHGEVYFQMDSVMGTIMADWLSDPVQVECLDWGSGTDTINKDAGFVSPDGVNTYTCNWDPETEWDVQPWQDIGVGYSTPDGHWVANAFRDERWMAFWTYTPDPPTGFFAEGDHSYYYQWAYTAPVSDSGISGPRAITIAGDPTPIYDWYALIGPWGLYYPGNFRPQLAWTGSACEEVSVLHPNQPMRFVWGWVNDYSMTYEEALTHFSSFTIDVFWDFFSDGITDGSATLATMSELIPFTGRDARFEYLCTLTEHP